MQILQALFGIFIISLLAVSVIGLGLYLILPKYRLLPFGILLILLGIFELILLIQELFKKEEKAK